MQDILVFVAVAVALLYCVFIMLRTIRKFCGEDDLDKESCSGCSDCSERNHCHSQPADK